MRIETLRVSAKITSINIAKYLAIGIISSIRIKTKDL